VRSTPDAAHWQRVRRLLESALEQAPDEQRAFVDKACGDDPALKSELESLIRHGEAPDFLSEGAPWDASDALLLLRTTNLEGERLGAWRIEERIAIGGMGAVYRPARTRCGLHVAGAGAG